MNESNRGGGPGQERYSRQVLFAPIGRQGQEKLLGSRVALIGLGALGTVSANCLARAGAGFLRLVDRDFVEPSNLQRQILYTEEDAAGMIPKALAARQRLAAINADITCEALVEDVSFENIGEIIRDVDLVLDGTDNFEVRCLINEACVREGIPWIYGACVASYGITFTILPGETPCLHCFLGGHAAGRSAETCDTAGVLASVVNVVASIQCAEALKLLTGNRAALRSKAFFIDLWQNQWMEFDPVKIENCTVCCQKNYPHLAGEMQQQATYLCGRDAVQVLPARKTVLPLDRLQEKLSSLGPVTGNEYLLKFTIDPYELIIFPDGRAMVKGTGDLKVARSLYARYIGS